MGTKTIKSWDIFDENLRMLFLEGKEDHEIADELGVKTNDIRLRRGLLGLLRKRGGAALTQKTIKKILALKKEYPEITNTEIGIRLGKARGQINLIISRLGMFNFDVSMVESVKYEKGVRIEKCRPGYAYGSEPMYNRKYNQ